MLAWDAAGSPRRAPPASTYVASRDSNAVFSAGLKMPSCGCSKNPPIWIFLHKSFRCEQSARCRILGIFEAASETPIHLPQFGRGFLGQPVGGFFGRHEGVEVEPCQVQRPGAGRDNPGLHEVLDEYPKHPVDSDHLPAA